MSKRKRSPVAHLKTEWEEAIHSSDITECNLLEKKKARVAALIREGLNRGLSNKGNDALTCADCEGNYKLGGKHEAPDCGGEECTGRPRTEGLCIDCMKKCISCDVILCDDCCRSCSSFEDLFCEGCLAICCSCDDVFCDRDKSEPGGEFCSLIGVGYGGESSCSGCLKRY